MKKDLFKSFTTIIILTCLLIISFGCKKDNEDTQEVPNEENFDPIVPTTTKIISQEDCNAFLENIDTTEISFQFKKELLDHYSLEVGDVITLPLNGGYVREITEIQDQKGGLFVIIKTKFASLIKALQQGKVDYNFPLDFTKAKPIYTANGLKNFEYTDDGKEGQYTIDEVIYKNGNNEIRVSGNFTLGATIYGTLKIKDFKLNKFSFNNDIGEEINLQGNCTFDILTWDGEVEFISQEFTSIPMVIGGIPFIMTPILDIYLGASVDLESQINTSVHQDLTLKTGATWYMNNWTPHMDVDTNLSGQPPTCSTSANFQIWVRPQIRVMIDRVLAPKISERFYGQLTANTTMDPWWVLCTGLDVNLGIQMEFFEQADWNMDVLNFKDTLYKADGPFGNSSLSDSIKVANHFSNSFKVWYNEQDHQINHYTNPPTEYTYYGDEYINGVTIGNYQENIVWNGNSFEMLIWFPQNGSDTNFYSAEGQLAADGKTIENLVLTRNYTNHDTAAGGFTYYYSYETTFNLYDIELEEVSGKTIKFKTEDAADFQNIDHTYYIQTKLDGTLYQERWFTNTSTLPLSGKENFISIFFMIN